MGSFTHVQINGSVNHFSMGHAGHIPGFDQHESTTATRDFHAFCVTFTRLILCSLPHSLKSVRRAAHVCAFVRTLWRSRNHHPLPHQTSWLTPAPTKPSNGHHSLRIKLNKALLPGEMTGVLTRIIHPPPSPALRYPPGAF